MSIRTIEQANSTEKNSNRRIRSTRSYYQHWQRGIPVSKFSFIGSVPGDNNKMFC